MNKWSLLTFHLTIVIVAPSYFTMTEWCIAESNRGQNSGASGVQSGSTGRGGGVLLFPRVEGKDAPARQFEDVIKDIDENGGQELPYRYGRDTLILKKNYEEEKFRKLEEAFQKIMNGSSDTTSKTKAIHVLIKSHAGGLDFCTPSEDGTKCFSRYRLILYTEIHRTNRNVQRVGQALYELEDPQPFEEGEIQPKPRRVPLRFEYQDSESQKKAKKNTNQRIGNAKDAPWVITFREAEKSLAAMREVLKNEDERKYRKELYEDTRNGLAGDNPDSFYDIDKDEIKQTKQIYFKKVLRDPKNPSAGVIDVPIEFNPNRAFGSSAANAKLIESIEEKVKESNELTLKLAQHPSLRATSSAAQAGKGYPYIDPRSGLPKSLYAKHLSDVAEKVSDTKILTLKPAWVFNDKTSLEEAGWKGMKEAFAIARGSLVRAYDKGITEIENKLLEDSKKKAAQDSKPSKFNPTGENGTVKNRIESNSPPNFDQLLLDKFADQAITVLKQPDNTRANVQVFAPKSWYTQWQKEFQDSVEKTP